MSRARLDDRGELLSRDQLLNDVWGYDTALYSRTVDVHIASLRQKVEPDLPASAVHPDATRPWP